MSARHPYFGGPRRPERAHAVGVALLAAALALVLLLLAPDHDAATKTVVKTRQLTNAPSRPVHVAAAARRTAGRTAEPSVPLAVVTLARRGVTRTVPASFLGISTEYWALPLFDRDGSLLERALSLFRTPFGGPLVLRIGGDSADHTFWGLKSRDPPRWVVDLGPRWLQQLSALVNRLDARVIVDLNLVTDSPLTAARWAGAAYRDLPRGSVVGFEVGNEPDLYERRYWLGVIAHPALSMSVLPKDLSPATYSRDFQTYASTLGQVAPHVPLVAPAVANPSSGLDWISTLLASTHPRLGTVSGHVYPYSACVRPHRAIYATIARVLSENASAGVAARVRPAVRLAHRAALPFRLTELNSVTCGGMPGVSDTFATALWAPDALFELLRAGVNGVNVHVRARAVNAAFSLGRGGLVAHPLMYGLMLFNRTLGPGARVAPVSVHVRARAPHLKVWAVRVRGGALHVLLIDKGRGAVRVDLRLPATGAATVERLLAPAVTSRRAVTLAGQQVGPDGGWQGERVTETVWPGTRGYVVTVPRMSAALVGMHLASARQARLGARTFAGVSRPVNRRRRAALSVGALRRGVTKRRRARPRAETPAEPPARRL